MQLMIDLAHKDIKNSYFNTFHMFKKVTERVSIMKKDIEDPKMTQIKFLEFEITLG